MHSKPSPVSTGSLCLASLVAPLTTPILVTLGLYVIDAVKGNNPFARGWDSSLNTVLMVVVMVALPATWALGFPLALVLRRMGRLTALNISLGAACIGGLGFVAVIALIAGRFVRLGAVVEEFAIGGGVGLGAGLVFCAAAGVPLRARP